MNEIIKKQMEKITDADMSHFDPETNTYFIPQRKQIKLEEDHCYLIHCKKELYNNRSLKENWNQNKEFPQYAYLKVDVSKKMGNMVKVVGSGFDFINNVDTSYFWSGWLNTQEIEVLEKL